MIDPFIKPLHDQQVTEFLQECFFDSVHNHAAAEEIKDQREQIDALKARIAELESAKRPRAKRSEVQPEE